MPPLPPGYFPPLPVPHDPTVREEGDIERLRGGDVFCETYYDRDMIPAIYRREGITTAYVKQGLGTAEYPSDSFWYLHDGITNMHWRLRSESGGNTSGNPETSTTRTATYTAWETLHNTTPGGLRIAKGVVCAIIADAGSAAVSLSNAQADTAPRGRRLPNAGEILGFKLGEGDAVQWPQLAIYYPFPEVYYPAGTGRVLGTQTNGATHVYTHPVQVMKAIFGPVYSPPALNVSLTSSGTNINGGLYEVGQVLPAVSVNVQPVRNTHRIRLGQAFEVTGNRVQLGADETAASPNSLGNFSRPVAGFSITPATGQYDAGSGQYRRQFLAAVTDTRPAAEGGEYRAESGVLTARATYPIFFGKSTATLPTDPAALGAWLQANLTPQLLGRQNYAPGVVQYRNGERPVFAYPAAWGPLSRIDDAVGGNQLGVSFNMAVGATLGKTGQYATVPYLVYTTSNGFSGNILYAFVF